MMLFVHEKNLSTRHVKIYLFLTSLFYASISIALGIDIQSVMQSLTLKL